MNRISLKPLWLISLAALAASAFADTVVLTNGEKIEGKVTAETDTEITIADLTGVGVLDAAVANAVVSAAESRGVGRWLEV